MSETPLGEDAETARSGHPSAPFRAGRAQGACDPPRPRPPLGRRARPSRRLLARRTGTSRASPRQVSCARRIGPVSTAWPRERQSLAWRRSLAWTSLRRQPSGWRNWWCARVQPVWSPYGAPHGSTVVPRERTGSFVITTLGLGTTLLNSSTGRVPSMKPFGHPWHLAGRQGSAGARTQARLARLRSQARRRRRTSVAQHSRTRLCERGRSLHSWSQCRQRPGSQLTGRGRSSRHAYVCDKAALDPNGVAIACCAKRTPRFR